MRSLPSCKVATVRALEEVSRSADLLEKERDSQAIGQRFLVCLLGGDNGSMIKSSDFC